MNLETTVGSRKYAQVLNASGKFEKAFITNKVTTSFSNLLCTSISCTPFSRPTAIFRLNNFITRSARIALGSVLLCLLYACTGGGGDDVSPLQRPAITPIGDQTAEEGEALSFTVSASNEGPTPVLSVADLPPGASFDPATGAFSWIPADGDAAVSPFSVTFTATDPVETGLSGSETIKITVLPFGSGTFTAIPPVITPDGGTFLDSVTVSMTTASDGATIFYTLDGADPTENSLQYGGPFELTESATVNARAFRGDLVNSNLSRAIFIITRNEQPVLDPIGARTVVENQPLSFTVTASDAESTPVLSAAPLPPGATFDPTTGIFSWIPVDGDSINSPYSVTFTATDEVDPSLTASETVAITVTPVPNELPVLNAIGDRSVVELQVLSFVVTATDAESIPVLSAAPLPPGATFDPATGMFSWVPAAGASASSPYSVTFKATDAEDSSLVADETIAITVTAPANQPPVLNAIGDQIVAELQPLSFTVTATDDGLAPPLLAASALPPGAFFDESTGVFSWTPGAGAVVNSPYSITFTATDALDPNLTDSQPVTITVTAPANQTPVLTVPASQTVEELQTLSFTVSATDDGPAPTLTATGSALDSGATFDPATGALQWVTVAGDAAGSPYSVTFTATDAVDTSLTDTETVSISVTAVTIVADCTVGITSPAAGDLQTSPDLLVDTTLTCTPAIPAGWGTKLVVVGANSGGGEVTVTAEPFSNTFVGLAKDEYTVTVTVVDASGADVSGAQTQAQVTPAGIGDYYVAFGDSITNGVGDGDTSDDTSNDGRNSALGYTPILNNLLTNQLGYPHTVVNAGSNGEFSAGGASRIGDVLAANPDAQRILVMYGMNDANPALPVPPAAFKANMQQIINAITAAGKEVVLAKINIALGDGQLTTPPYSDPIDDGARNVNIIAFNQVIDQLRAENGISVAAPDFYTLFKNNTQYSYNIHPNGAGYQSMADGWRQVVQ